MSQSPAPTKTMGQRPIYESPEGDFAVFLKSVPSANRTEPPYEVYNVAVGPRGETRQYFEAYTSLFRGGPQVDPSQLESIFRGATIGFDAVSRTNPDETYLLAVGGLVESKSIPRRDGTGTFNSAHFKYLLANPVFDEAGDITAFLLPESNARGADKIKFWRNVGPRNNPIRLEVTQCYRLMAGEKLNDGSVEIAQESIDAHTVPAANDAPARTFKTAVVRVNFIDQQQTADGQTPDRSRKP